MIFSADGRTRLLFIEVPDVKPVKNRLHLDLRPLDTREAEVDRLLGRGATLLADRRRTDGSGWVTMADPEGNEFCVLRGDQEFADPYAHLSADARICCRSAAPPARCEPDPGSCRSATDLAISGETGWAPVVRRLLHPATGWELPARPDGRLRLSRQRRLRREAYRLEVGDDGIEHRRGRLRRVDLGRPDPAATDGRRRVPPGPDRATAFVLGQVVIDDAPRFGWRGVHAGRRSALHAAGGPVPLRRPAQPAQVQRVPPAPHRRPGLAARLRPLPATAGGGELAVPKPCAQLHDAGDGTPHGGFYTADQLRSLVRYAADRGVTMLPELEFPGHVRAVLAAYPELGNHQETQHATVTTSSAIFDEVLEPDEPRRWSSSSTCSPSCSRSSRSPYVHVGGDEVPDREWLASPSARRPRRASADWPVPEYLQRWFTEQLRDWLAERGRRLVGWDEINDEGPLHGAVVDGLAGRSYGIAAAERRAWTS